MALKVQEPISVSCLRSRSRDTSRSRPRPRRQSTRAPGSCGTHSREPRRRHAGAIQCEVHARPAGQLPDSFSIEALEELRTTSAPNCFASARRSSLVSMAITRAPIFAPSSVALMPTGPGEHRERRAPRAACGAARRRRCRCRRRPRRLGEGQLVGQRHQGARRHLQVFGVAAVGRHAVDGNPSRHSCDQPSRQ